MAVKILKILARECFAQCNEKQCLLKEKARLRRLDRLGSSGTKISCYVRSLRQSIHFFTRHRPLSACREDHLVSKDLF